MSVRKLFSNRIFLVICFMVFFKPLLLWDRLPFSLFLKPMQIVVWITVGMASLAGIRQWRMYHWLWGVFCSTSLCVILITPTPQSGEAAELLLSFLFLVYFLDIIFTINNLNIIKLLWYYLFCTQILELISIPMYYKGMINTMWFGIRTRGTDAAIPFILISFLLYRILERWKVTMGIVVAAANIVLLKISTGMIGLIIIFILTWLIHYKHLSKLLNILKPGIMLLSTLGITISVVFFEIQTKFSWLIYSLFGKDVTLSSRTEIWANAIFRISQESEIRRMWGYGFRNFSNWCSWHWSVIWTEAHCQLLQLLHDTGIVGVIVFYLFLYFMLRELRYCKTVRIRFSIAIFCFTMLIIAATEIYVYYPYFFILFALAARSKKLSELIAEGELRNDT